MRGCSALSATRSPRHKNKRHFPIDTLTSYVQRESRHIRDIQESIQETDAGDFASEAQAKVVYAQYGVRAGQASPCP